ncbi:MULTISPECIES: TonB-dependent receptor [unclassified Sphingobium]|uniref:TonB-dependent receptor n=1 Tax=unclassified Sphingobium TaxID=2611147 RepID=UPI0013054867|nr:MULTISPECIES: TonB-dependent receptor [unclassified Sphingobium]
MLYLLLSTASLGAGVAQAQVQPEERTTTEEIIVTAQKRSERLSDVPLSITAATGDQLLKQGVTSPSDLARIAPGFAFQKSAYGVPVFTIRGIGLFDNFLGVSPTVTVYVDQAPLPYLAMTPAAGLDVERVEVLKGPQGTLFGQNSTGGAINYIAAKPTKDLQAGIDLTYGRFDQIDAQAFVSGPLTDTLAARVAVRHEYRGDWQYSMTRPNDRRGQRDFTAVRLLLDWTPSDSVRFELNANAWWDKSDTQAAQFRSFAAALPNGYPEVTQAIGNLASAPDNNRAADWDVGADLRRDDSFRQISLRSDVDLSDDITLTAITSYIDFSLYSPNDNDGTDFVDYFGTLVGDAKTFFQEVRLAGKATDRLTFTVGGNYGHDNVKGTSVGRNFGSNSGIGPFRYYDFNQRADQKVRTLAGFAALDYQITDKLTIQASARYTDQKRKLSGCLEDGGDGRLAAAIDFVHFLANGVSDPASPGGCVTLDSTTFERQSDYRDNLSENNLSWRASVNWKPSDDSLLYANVTKGYKSGTFSSVPAVFTAQFDPVVQESVLAYEAGFKASVLDRRAQISGAAFYYDYRNKQVLGIANTLFGLLPALQGVPKASVRGAELEVTLHPTERLRLTAGGTYVDSSVDRANANITDPLGVPINIEGESFPNTPKWQFVGDAQYDIPLSADLNAFLGGGVTYRSSSFAAFGRTPEFKIDGYALVDLRAGVETADGRWRVQLWGRNVFNTYHWMGVVHPVDTTVRLTGMPATYGITLNSRF